jgi:hypothetical protein
MCDDDDFPPEPSDCLLIALGACGLILALAAVYGFL